MNEGIEGESGMILVCLKGNKKHGTKAGKFYIYDYGKLKTFTTRTVTIMLNGDEILVQPEAFQVVNRCPFCKLLAPPGQQLHEFHNGADCAAEWDAKVKKYCRECSATTVNGKCPKCDAEE